MKKLVLLLGAAVALTCGVAIADTTPTPAGSTPTPQAAAPGPDNDAAATPGDKDGMDGDWHPGMHRWWGHHHRGMDGGDGHADMNMRGGPGGPDGMGPMGMHRFGGGGGMQSKAARFVFAGPHGARIMIKCADVDTTQQCADAAKGLIAAIGPALHRDQPPAPGTEAPKPAQ